MKHDIDTATAWPKPHFADIEGAPDTLPPHDATDGVWQNTIAAADHALEEANRIQRGVQQHLKLMQEVRALRDELHKAHAEVDRYRGMHARVVVGMRQLEEDNNAEIARLRADNEILQVRHRVYKLLAEHYALAAQRMEPSQFAEHRDRVLEHVLFQRRKGVPVTQMAAADIAFLLM
jgi:hypothetical protein